jgi:predicted DNA-binding transcriptional regulator AlpA
LLTAKRAAKQPVMQLHELSVFLGVAKRTGWRYTRRDDFPVPFAVLSTGKVWRTTDVQRWQKKHGAPFPAGRKPAKQRG